MAHVETYVPEFQEKRRRRRAYFVFLSALIILYVIILGASWLVLRTPIFHIREIRVVGNDAVSSGDIVALLQSRVIQGKFFRALLGINNFLNWPGQLDEEDLIFLPEIKSVNIEKDYRDRIITIRVEEREPRGIWCLESRCWWFDGEGIIFRKALLAQGSLITVVVDISQDIPGLGAKILPERFIQNVFSIFKVVEASGLGIKKIGLDDIALEELKVETFDGPTIYFSLRFLSENALPVIQNLSSKDGFGDMDYLDFRVEDRVYYK